MNSLFSPLHVGTKSTTEYTALDFPADRSLTQDSSGKATVAITLPPLSPRSAVQSEITIVAFGALFVFSRLLNQKTVQACLVTGNDPGPTSFVCAEISPDMTLAQAFTTLRIGAASGVTDVNLSILAPFESSIGADTELSLHDDAAGLRLSLDFDTGRLAPLSAQDFLEKIGLVMDALDTTPDMPCADLILLSTAARKLIPDLSLEIDTHQYEHIPTTFFRVATQYSECPAIANDACSYTYRELSRVVSKLTAQLIGAGLKPGDVVAVAGFSSFGMLASMLAVLTGGGVLVTVDHALPEERQKLISDISQPRLRIQVRSARDSDPALESTIVATDWPDGGELSRLSDTSPFVAEPASEDSAYVFFTSGSTGVPKGVLGTHLGLAHFLGWQRSNFPIGPGDRVAQLTALSFDVVLRDILFPLTSGACIHIPKCELLFDARRMLRWINESAITAMHCVPSLMKAWLQAHTGGKPFQSLRYIFFAGEPLIDTLLNRLVEAAGLDTRIVNLYGPTETTLAKLANRIERVEPGVQPVGTPQPGVDAIIVRDRRTPCGLWEIGEIAIRTPYRSKGYLNNEALTRQVFVQNPYRNDPTDLIYYTGDLGRYRSDGKIEIFGRIDSQIKIRGVRIEPNEIESQLLKLPGVSDAAVTARIGANEEKVLLALIVPDTPIAAEQQHEFGLTIRESLKGKLHEAMVPARVFVLHGLPYLPNGKLDRKAIAALQLEISTKNRSSTKATASLDDRMRILVVGIEDALDTPVDTLDKSFIDFGGDSLSYIRVSMLIEDILGWLPQDWERKPLSEFSQLWAESSATPEATWLTLEVTLLFRAISIVLVTMSHTNEFPFITATSTLFVISGMNFSKFLRPAIRNAGDISPTVNLIFKFGIPAGLWQGFRGIIMHKFWIPDLLLLGTFFQNPAAPHYTLWYLDVLAANLLLLALIGKAGYRLHHRTQNSREITQNSFWTDLFLVLAGLSIAFAQVASGWADGEVGKTDVAPFKWFWLLALGILITQANNTKRKWLVSALLVGLALGTYSGLPQVADLFRQIDAFFFASVLIMIWIERVPVPRLLQRPLVVIASSTLFIYIVNYSVIVHLIPKFGLPNWWALEVATAMATGIVVKVIWDQVVTRASSLFHHFFEGQRRASSYPPRQR